jgi:iron complex outermembrane receptor protein
LPAIFGNDLQGDTYGIESWATYSPLSWWRLAPGVSLLRKELDLKPGSTEIAGVQTAQGLDPGHQFFLRSYMDLPHNLEFYVGLRDIGSLKMANIPSYFEADARLGWHVTPQLDLSITGENLIHAHHLETDTGNTPPNDMEIPRKVIVGVRWSF